MKIPNFSYYGSEGKLLILDPIEISPTTQEVIMSQAINIPPGTAHMSCTRCLLPAPVIQMVTPEQDAAKTRNRSSDFLA